MTKNEQIASILLEAAELLKNDTEALTEGIITNKIFNSINNYRIKKYVDVLHKQDKFKNSRIKNFRNQYEETLKQIKNLSKDDKEMICKLYKEKYKENIYPIICPPKESPKKTKTETEVDRIWIEFFKEFNKIADSMPEKPTDKIEKIKNERDLLNLIEDDIELFCGKLDKSSKAKLLANKIIRTENTNLNYDDLSDYDFTGFNPSDMFDNIELINVIDGDRWSEICLDRYTISLTDYMNKRWENELDEFGQELDCQDGYYGCIYTFFR